MSLFTTPYEHIVLNAADSPLIAGTTMKVIELVVEYQAYGWSPEELHLQHPYLTLGQIYSALAYYWDHQSTLDQEIAAQLASIEAQARQAADTPLRANLLSRT